MGTQKQQEIRVTALGLVLVALLAAVIAVSIAMAMNGGLQLPSLRAPTSQGSSANSSAVGR